MEENKKEHSPQKEYAPPKGSKKEGKLELGKGASLEYTAYADWIVLRKKEKPAAEIFHVAYLQKGKSPGKRPLTFVFNGGPGAASAYLHLGALGPKRALFHPEGTALPPPVKLVDNPESWLDFTDLVFVDPVGTGFSRAVEKEAGKGKPEPAEKQTDEKGKPAETEFYGLKRDLESLGEFMQKCLSRYGRWESPVFVAGESYGGFRAAKLARLAQQDFGIGLNGAVIISPALEFAALDHSDYDILPWINGFPTMAAAAFFHGRSKAFPEGTDVDAVLREAEAFSTGEMACLLASGCWHLAAG